MKKSIFLLFVACLLSVGQAMADNRVTVNDVNVPQGGQATIEIGCEFDTEYTGFQLELSLPDGLSLLTDEEGYPVIDKDFDTNHVLTGNLLPSNGNYRFTCRSMDNISIPSSGALFRVTVVADASVAFGSLLPATITACEFTRTADSQGENLADVDFTISITEFRTVLDETSTTPPVAEENANVRVRRTIKANEWSTICLPFAMTETQVKAVFGDDVQLGDFTGTEPEFDGGDNVVGIKVNFSSVSAIAANHPYIIKVSAPITEFTLDGVDIVTDEDEAYIEFDNGKSGSRRVVYSGFYGTYHAGTVLDKFTLFLSDNKFWYSKGLTKMKAFRAYFEFLDVLTEVEEAYSSRIAMTFNDANSIENIEHSPLTIEHSVYDLQGRRVSSKLNDKGKMTNDKVQKGLYIVNGKKVIK